MTKVAVITRTKDRTVFLKRALKSVSAQTNDDYIHVIVNDGGDKKQVEETVKKFGASGKTRIFHRATPSNAPDTIFNESVDRVKSDYVVIHDDDDSWHPEFLANMIAVLDSGAKGAVARTDKIVEQVSAGKIIHKKTEQFMPEVKVINLYKQCVVNQLTPIAFVYRRNVYEEIGKYDSSLPVVGDWEFGIRFLMKYDVEFVDPGFALANYHHRVTKNDNSFAAHDHRYYFNKVANEYLRRELADGRLGPGFIINQTRFEQSNMAAMVKRVLPGFVTSRLKKRIED